MWKFNIPSYAIETRLTVSRLLPYGQEKRVLQLRAGMKLTPRVEPKGTEYNVQYPEKHAQSPYSVHPTRWSARLQYEPSARQRVSFAPQPETGRAEGTQPQTHVQVRSEYSARFTPQASASSEQLSTQRQLSARAYTEQVLPLADTFVKVEAPQSEYQRQYLRLRQQTPQEAETEVYNLGNAEDQETARHRLWSQIHVAPISSEYARAYSSTQSTPQASLRLFSESEKLRTPTVQPSKSPAPKLSVMPAGPPPPQQHPYPPRQILHKDLPVLWQNETEYKEQYSSPSAHSPRTPVLGQSGRHTPSSSIIKEGERGSTPRENSQFLFSENSRRYGPLMLDCPADDVGGKGKENKTTAEFHSRAQIDAHPQARQLRDQALRNKYNNSSRTQVTTSVDFATRLRVEEQLVRSLSD
eukprot:m.221770 g.221770  ORF g.221770 m.221770 type:complete len:412 (-) comp54168_c0_seq16:1360-2595(-)